MNIARTIQRSFLPILLNVIALVPSYAQTSPLDLYSIQWHTQSNNAGESMPCGGGDIGLNVWVEQGSLFFYLAKSGTFDENNQFLKLGRVRLTLAPNPFDAGNDFLQVLNLKDGRVEITGRKNNQKTTVLIWVDVFSPVVRAEVKSFTPVAVTATYESWRTADRIIPVQERSATSYKSMPAIDVISHKDDVAFKDTGVLFYHHNKKDNTVFDFTVAQQGLNQVKERLWNPVASLTFGGSMQGESMIPAGTVESSYAGIPFTGWQLKSKKPATTHSLSIVLHTEQTANMDEWQQALGAVLLKSRVNIPASKAKSEQWWSQFWARSHIYINPTTPDNESPVWQVGRNYQLFRYMLGCNVFGEYPTKFNGGLFTYDPVFVSSDTPFNADFRRWGGGTFTAQNQRLVYWPMLKSGDVDMMIPQFKFYLRALKNAELRSEVYWQHQGACFTEQVENFGLPQCFEYDANTFIFGTERPPSYSKGVQFNNWISYGWDTALEFCLMILDAEQYTGQDIASYVPLIESVLTFFEQHYQQAQLARSTHPLDANGHLVIFPGSAAETYKTTYNASSTIAGLHTVISRLIALPKKYLTDDRRSYWSAMLTRVPPIPLRVIDGHTMIAPALAWERINNEEIPQLYPVYPYGMYGIGKPNLDIAINTWKYDTTAQKFKSHVGWKQDNIFCARMGLTDEAAAITTAKLKNSATRFPTFWGPGFDWTPDHNWGGSGMIGLQEMLLQADGTKLYLFPAWPLAWDVDFKLHAPFKTTVEGKLVGGKIISLKVSPESRRKDVIIMLGHEDTTLPR